MSIHRVIRGGSFKSITRILRAASRVANEPEDRSSLLGFRVVIKQRRKP